MKTKPIYSIFFTLSLTLYPLTIPVIAQDIQPSSENTIDENQTTNSFDENSPYLRPFLKPLENNRPTPVNTPIPEMEAYKLGPGDVISISVFNVGDQGGQYPIFMDGTVSIPLIGQFKLEGKTIAEVNKLFTEQYARYIKRPIVTVVLQSQRPLQLGIVGEVNNPGNYNIPSNPAEQPRITNLVDLAGGLTVSADISKVTLRRQENEREDIYVLNFWDLLRNGDLSRDVSLQDGDVIIIPKKTIVNSEENRQLSDATFGIKYKTAPNITLIGEIKRPGSYSVPIDGGEPRLTSAIKTGGGIKELADIRNIEVRRTTRDGEEQTINVDLWEMLQTGDLSQDLLVQDGDRIIIPTAEDIDPTEAQTLASANFSPDTIAINIIGPVRGAGAKQLPPNTSLNEAIYSAGGFDERRADQGSVELIRMNPNGTVTRREIQIEMAANVNNDNNPILQNKDVIIVDRNTVTKVVDGISTILAPIGSVFSFTNIFRSFDNLF